MNWIQFGTSVALMVRSKTVGNRGSQHMKAVWIDVENVYKSLNNCRAKSKEMMMIKSSSRRPYKANVLVAQFFVIYILTNFSTVFCFTFPLSL